MAVITRRYRVIRPRRGKLLAVPPPPPPPPSPGPLYPPLRHRHRYARLGRPHRGRHLLWVPPSATPATAQPVMWSVPEGRNAGGTGMFLTQPAASSGNVQAQVYATVYGAAYDPAGDTVQAAFIPAPTAGLPPDPASGQWHPASWVTDPGPVYWASVLVGPGGVVLTAGSYYTAWQVTDNPTVPVLWGPVLVIT